MSLLKFSTRRRRRRTEEPGGEGLMMPRGPLGSRWALDATGPDGGFPTICDQLYGRSSTSATPFAQAADFYDSVGINTHPNGTYRGITTPAQRALAIDRIQEMGIRHVRGLGLYSIANKNDGIMWNGSQHWVTDCLNANAARNRSSGGPDGQGEQPLINKIGTEAEPAYLTTFWQSQNNYKIDPAAEPGLGLSTFLPLFGPPGTPATVPAYNQTTHHWGGNVYGRNGLTSPASTANAIGWGYTGFLSGPNEPDNNRQFMAGDLPTEKGIRYLGHEMTKLRDNPAYRDIEVLPADEEYVDWNTGRITPGPATLKQVPVAPFCHMVGQNGWTQCGDYTATRGAHGDFGVFHQYYSHRPIWEQTFGDAVGTYGFFQNAAGVNGTLNPAAGGVRFNRSIPMLQTEQGAHTWPPTNLEQYHPQDVAGEVLINCLLNNYCLGIKRTYIYKLSHEGLDDVMGYDEDAARPGGWPPPMGVCLTDMTRTESFYAIKNLMALVRWTQGAQTAPIQVPHSFTVSGTFAYNSPGSGSIRDRMLKLVLQQDDGYIVILWRPAPPLFYRNVYRDRRNLGDNHATALAAARTTPSSTVSVILTIPSGLTATGIAEPAKNPILDPDDGQFYANANDGQAYAAPGVTNNGFSVSGQTATVRMCGLTRVIKLEP